MQQPDVGDRARARQPADVVGRVTAIRPTTEPNGCQHCGIPQWEHARQWTDEAGWHAWVAPSSAQILARMKARRAKP